MILKEKISYQLIKYICPIWYFHLRPYNIDNRVWINFDQLSKDEKELIQYDEHYSDGVLSNWDASYQALMKGVIKQADNNYQIEKVELFPADIYRFIRKYHKKIWLYTTFIQRLFSLCNPLSESIALWKTRKVKRINLFHTYHDYDNYPDYVSQLIKSNPLLTIIIPTFNRYKSLNNILEDLQNQYYTNFEVIIIDQSTPFLEHFYTKFNLKHNVIRQKEPALWRSRNSGVKLAQSDYLLFLDDDSRIKPNWILEHLKCIDFFRADISSGVSFSKIGSKIPENYHYFRYSDQLDTGNVLIKKKVFIKSGLFDEQFEKMRMGDGEFGLRAYLNGFKNIANPKAYREHLKISTGGLRDMGHWDAFRSESIFAPRPIPSVLYLYRKYWGKKAALLNLFQTIPLSYSPYYMKDKKVGYLISITFFILFSPIVIIQIIRSWHKSTHMLKVGAIINTL